MTAADDTDAGDEGAPFAEVPSGIDIARYFWHETERRNPGCDGISLYQEGSDYCYLWIEAMVDLDMWHAYLLDVRTKIDGDETRDFLFLFVGAGEAFDVQWHNQPIAFAAPVNRHRDRFVAGMRWLTSRTERALEDRDKRDDTCMCGEVESEHHRADPPHSFVAQGYDTDAGDDARSNAQGEVT